MRDQGFRELLQSLDDAWHAEAPPDFDRDAAEREFVALIPALSEAIGEAPEFETGGLIQDASFHSQVRLPRIAQRAGGESADAVILRFSNFGRMVALSPEEAVDVALLERLRSLLTRAGYTVIPERLLDEPYTGANPGVDGISSWWIRYFDWV